MQNYCDFWNKVQSCFEITDSEIDENDPITYSNNPQNISFCIRPQWIGDGECDSANKNPGCNYDGGDCCKREWISDGECDNLNKFASCSNYDGGDCARPSGK